MQVLQIIIFLPASFFLKLQLSDLLCSYLWSHDKLIRCLDLMVLLCLLFSWAWVVVGFLFGLGFFYLVFPHFLGESLEAGLLALLFLLLQLKVKCANFTLCSLWAKMYVFMAKSWSSITITIKFPWLMVYIYEGWILQHFWHMLVNFLAQVCLTFFFLLWCFPAS